LVLGVRCTTSVELTTTWGEPLTLTALGLLSATTVNKSERSKQAYVAISGFQMRLCLNAPAWYWSKVSILRNRDARNGSGRGLVYCDARGEIQRPSQDTQMRRRLSRPLSSARNDS